MPLKNSGKNYAPLNGNPDEFPPQNIDVNPAPNQTENNQQELALVPQTTYRSLAKEFIPQAWDYSFMRMLDVGSEIVIGVYFSRIDQAHLAANALIIPIQRFLTSTGTAFLFGMANAYKEDIQGNINTLTQEEKDKRIGEITRQGIYSALGLSAIGMGVALGSGPLLKISGQSDNVAGIVGDYYMLAFPSVPLTLIFSCYQQLTLRIGKQSISRNISLINNLMICGLGYLLTNDSFGPQLDAKGLGLAYTISYTASMTGLCVYLSCNQEFKKYQLFSFSMPDKKYINYLFRLGAPIGMQVAGDYLLRIAFAILLGKMGDDQLEASRIAEMMYVLLLTIILRAPQVTNKLTKDAFKDNNLSKIRQILYVNVGSILALTAIWTGIVEATANYIPRLFVSEGADNYARVTEETNYAFWLYPLGLIFEIERFAIAGSLRGMEDTKSSMWNSIGILDVIGIPLLIGGFALGADLPTLYGILNFVLMMASVSLTYQWSKKMKELELPPSNNTVAEQKEQLLQGAQSDDIEANNSVSSRFINYDPTLNASSNRNALVNQLSPPRAIPTKNIQVIITNTGSVGSPDYIPSSDPDATRIRMTKNN